MKTKTFLFYILAALLGGCVPIFSVSPLYTEKDVVFKDELLGVWADPNNPKGAWEFKRHDESKNVYKLIVDIGDDAKGLFDARLVNLNDRLFLDVYPNDEGIEQTIGDLEEKAKDPNSTVWPLNFAFLVPVHTFIKVDAVEPMLKMRLTDDDLMKKLLEQEPNAVKHVVLNENEDRFLLTASTEELQAFVLKYADGDKLFEKPIVLKRTEIKNPKGAGAAPGK
ncbi:MAG: hypothetical protein JXN61_00160, partial [Sedimentisphaerales bacterium]|nr:hypothetical protein [Sedimentisphaerales bacterium]